MKKITIFLFIILPTLIFAQVGIGTTTPDASAKLDISATDKGFLPPRVALTSTIIAAPITSPATGLLVYNTNTAVTTPAVNSVNPGYYYYNGTSWTKVSDLLSKVVGTNFTNSMIVGHTTTGTLNAATANTGVGISSLSSITTGDSNTALGYNTLPVTTTGSWNTAFGASTLNVNTGSENTGLGNTALNVNTSGGLNTAVGTNALRYNTTGSENTAVGYNAGGNAAGNATGFNNTFLGSRATTATNALSNSTAIGYLASFTTSNTIQLGNASVTTVNTSGALTTSQYKLSALNTAPASATAAGTLGEIRVTADSIYVCIATNTWVKAALVTF